MQSKGGEKFGEQIPFCEPYWYQEAYSPYYTENHKRFRATVRKFVEVRRCHAAAKPFTRLANRNDAIVSAFPRFAAAVARFGCCLRDVSVIVLH